MKQLFLLSFTILLISCTTKQKQYNINEINNTESHTSTINNIIEKDTLAFKYLYSKAEPNDSVRMFITHFDGVISRSGLRIIKVTLDNMSCDTLNFRNQTYQVRHNNSWETIPCANEDLGWTILPKSKGYNDFGLPSNYVFAPGLYRNNYVFSKNRNSNNFYNIYIYFELKEQ